MVQMVQMIHFYQISQNRIHGLITLFVKQKLLEMSKLNTGCTHTGTSLQQQLDDRWRHGDAHYRKKFFSQK